MDTKYLTCADTDRLVVGATLTRNGRWHATATVVAVSDDGRHIVTLNRWQHPVCSCGETCEHVRRMASGEAED